MRAVRTYALAAMTGVLVVAGCGGRKEGTGHACGPLAGAGTDLRSSRTGAADPALLTSVRVEPSGCVDRIAFDFRAATEGRPGFQAQYLPARRALVEDGSGRPIAVEGSAFLVVRLQPAATAEARGDELVRTYTGSRRLRAAGSRFVREVVKSGDFEAVVTWTIGLTEQRPFRTIASASPPRLVVEIG